MSSDTATLDTIRSAMEDRGSSSSSRSSSTCTAARARSSCPRGNLDDLVEDGAGFAGFAAGEIGQVPSDPDIAAIPDLDSFTLVPWQPNLARFACDVTVEGEAWPYCPRTILRNQLARAKELGYEFKLGIELEYFLVRAARRRLDRDRRRARHAREALLRHGRADAPATTSSPPSRSTATSSAGATTRTTTRTRTASSSRTSRTTTRSSSCDRAIFFRYMVHTLAEQHGMVATFMPKPFTHLTGNGCHFHMSLWDATTRTSSSTRPTRAGSASRRPRTTSSAG